MLVGGALAGAGGAQLSLKVGGFVADMSNGRGYIAIAMVDPRRAGGRASPRWRAFGIALADAVAIQLQVTGTGDPARASRHCCRMSLTVVVLAVAGNRRMAPRALGWK